MELTAPEVSRVLNALMAGDLTREAAEAWATARMDAFDRHHLAFAPGTEENRLWEAVIFLAGIALQSSPGTYLHDAADMAEFRARTGF